jgi:arsenate reductase (thioredoxin)
MMPTILFVCVHNAGRSVMAEAFLNQVAAGRATGVSAGTIPQDGPHREVVEAMREVGIDVSAHRGRLLTDELVRSADRVITMGCAVDADACPAVLYANVEDWGLDDPKGKDPDTVRRIRDEIRRRVDELVERSPG